MKEGFFADDWGLSDFCVGRAGPVAFGWVGNADEDHVPVGASPTVPLAVAGDPLLLGAGVDVAVDEGVGHPAAAGPALVLIEDDVALDVHATEGRGLRDGPLHGAAGGGDGEVFCGAPEGGGGVVVAGCRVGVDVAGDVDGVGRDAEAEDLGVEADGDVDVVVAG